MGEHKDWPKFREQVIMDFRIFQRQQNRTEPLTEGDMQAWSIELFQAVMGSMGHPGGSSNLQKFLTNHGTRMAYMNDIAKIRTAWRSKFNYTGTITKDELAEWSYAFIQELNNLDKRELARMLNSWVGQKLDKTKLPRPMKRAMQKMLEKSAKGMAGS